MVIDINRSNNAASGPSTGRAGSAPTGGRNEAISTTTLPAKPAVEASTTAKSGEPVQLSREAQQLQKVSDKLKDLPSADKERVTRLKQAVADGSYTIDNQKVAKKLMDFESRY